MALEHLLTVDDLDRETIERIVARAGSFAEVSGRDIKKVPALRGRTVATLFYENSTRTSSSFELAAKRLSADVIPIKAGGSSVAKGESLEDTVRTLSAYGPEVIVLRAPWAGAGDMITRWTDAAVVNAGDGKREHPSQSLLDIYTLRRHFDSLEGKKIWIVGDILHSRVARSNARAFRTMGAHVTLCGPPTLLPPQMGEALGCEVTHDITGVDDADVIYTLRIQNERMNESFMPSLAEYVIGYQINSKRLGAKQLLMHPGPVNRGVELSADVVGAPNSLIEQQVESGLVVRMAILYELLAGGKRQMGETA